MSRLPALRPFNPPRAIGRALSTAGVAAVLVASAVPGRSARADTVEGESQLVIAGGEEIAWLVVGQQASDPRAFLQWLFYLDDPAKPAKAALAIEPQVGRLGCWAVAGGALHVFFTTGTHYRYSRGGARREIRLPDDLVPLALAGDVAAGRSVLWAIVDARTADAVQRAWDQEQSRGTTRPATEPEDLAEPAAVDPDPEPPARPEGSFHLVQYRGIDWEPGLAAPRRADRSKRFWICVTANGHHLFWQAAREELEVQHAWFQEGRWEAGRPIWLTQPIHTGLAAETSGDDGQVVFAALARSPEDPNRLRLGGWAWRQAAGAGGGWEELPPATARDGSALILPPTSALGVFRDRLLVLQGSGESVEVGLWPVRGGPPEQPFGEVPLGQADRGPRGRRGLRDFAPTFVLAALMALVVWRRQDTIANPVILPADVIVAGLGRRTLAAILDAAPAAAAVTIKWHEPIARFAREVAAARTAEEMELIVPPPELLWAWVAFVLGYTGYCLLFEMVLTATPGKRLLGCQPFSESLTPPTRPQILMRNLSRLVELEPHLQVWPFLLVVLFTHHRQRVGDLVARTIVVEHREDLPEPPPAQESEDTTE